VRLGSKRVPQTGHHFPFQNTRFLSLW
jgi:hypothetical protein